jgi:hypothetical protein
MFIRSALEASICSSLIMGAGRVNKAWNLFFHYIMGLACYSLLLQGGIRVTELEARVWQLKLRFILTNCLYEHRQELWFKLLLAFLSISYVKEDLYHQFRVCFVPPILLSNEVIFRFSWNSPWR